MRLATFHQNERLGEIVIDNPPQNLFSADLLADLGVAVDQAAESDIRALLLRAEGDHFSAGADVSIFIGLDEARAAELETTVVSLIAAIGPDDVVVRVEAAPINPADAGGATSCSARLGRS
jgi:enoyl-CoA hydratase/carnithine racemase